MTSVSLTVQQNRLRFLAALYNEDPALQCQGQMFKSAPSEEHSDMCCATGVAIRVFTGIDSAAAYRAYIDASDETVLYQVVQDALGLESPDEIYYLNDGLDGTDGYSFSEIADIFAARWGMA